MIIQSDHKTLESILQKPLACAARRLQGMMLRLQKYTYELWYERGENLHLVDTLSRAYLPTIAHLGAEFEHIITTAFLPVSTSRLQEIQQATESDEALRILKNVILHGWPEHRGQVPSQIPPYFSMRDELAIQDGVIFRGQRIAVPVSLRHDLKRKLHSSVQNPVYADHGKPSFGSVETPK